MIKKALRLWVLLALGLLLTTAAYAQPSNISWRGQYYNNSYLIGASVVDFDSPSINFNWGNGSPATGINADGFSVRWAARVFFPAGTYRFYAQADDKVSVSVDFQEVLTTYNTDNVGGVVSGDVTLNAGTYNVQVNYSEFSGDAYVYVAWDNLVNNPTAPNFTGQPSTSNPQSGGTPVDLGGWTVQYYPNNSLSGLPTAILSESAIVHDWGTGSPVASVPADDFSGRWTTTSGNLEGGAYRWVVRADDGVRIFVDGRTVVDRWGSNVGETTTHDFTLSPGQHTFTVEYRELTDRAYIDVRLERVTPAASATVAPANTGATGTITAFRLNVRNAPNANAPIVLKVNRNESYPIVGRNADSSWWQLNVNGTVGWAFADFVNSSNTGAVPVTSGEGGAAAVGQGTGMFVTATTNVNLRSQPSSSGAILGQLLTNNSAEIIGRNSAGTWVQVKYNNGAAWVITTYVRVPVPVTDLPLVAGF